MRPQQKIFDVGNVPAVLNSNEKKSNLLLFILCNTKDYENKFAKQETFTVVKIFLFSKEKNEIAFYGYPTREIPCLSQAH